MSNNNHIFRQHKTPRAAAPPVMMDHRLWTDRKRLSRALAGIFEVRELPDLTLSGFSKWEEAGRTYWSYVLFNRSHQLLSIQILPENDLSELITQGVPVWNESDESTVSPSIRLVEASVDLLAAPTEPA